MKDEFDFEDALKKFEGKPGAGVKKSVLHRFAQTLEGRRSGDTAGGFWRRPIPLYAVAASLVVFIGLSFIAGQWSSRSDGPSDLSQEVIHEQDAITADDVMWAIAQRDLL